MYDLTGKVALVTGSSMGLGKAYALDLARAGASVVVNDPEGREAAEAVVKEIEVMGRKSFLAPCDVGQPDSVEKMIDDILGRFERIDILINNAGISIDGRTVDFAVESWARVMETNLNGAFYCSKFCLPTMIDRQWGRIINISSVVGQIGVVGTPAYTASKAGLIGFTKTLAKEVARKGITVNSLALGYFKDGGLMDTFSEQAAERVLSSIPVGRWGSIREVTSAVNYLVSDHASYITGQTININGGYHM